MCWCAVAKWTNGHRVDVRGRERVSEREEFGIKHSCWQRTYIEHVSFYAPHTIPGGRVREKKEARTHIRENNTKKTAYAIDDDIILLCTAVTAVAAAAIVVLIFEYVCKMNQYRV